MLPEMTSTMRTAVGKNSLVSYANNWSILFLLITVNLLDNAVTIHTATVSPIWTSLLSGLQSPLAVSGQTISQIVEDNNPRKIREMKETALYWVGKDGSPFTIKFPLLLDTEGYFGAIGPYFNLEKVRSLAYQPA